jgi:hypothetical protein
VLPDHLDLAASSSPLTPSLILTSVRDVRPRVDYDETFSLVVKSATVCTVLAIAISCDWTVQQLDVKNAILHGTLCETIFCS